MLWEWFYDKSEWIRIVGLIHVASQLFYLLADRIIY